MVEFLSTFRRNSEFFGLDEVYINSSKCCGATRIKQCNACNLNLWRRVSRATLLISPLSARQEFCFLTQSPKLRTDTLILFKQPQFWGSALILKGRYVISIFISPQPSMTTFHSAECRVLKLCGALLPPTLCPMQSNFIDRNGKNREVVKLKSNA